MTAKLTDAVTGSSKWFVPNHVTIAALSVWLSIDGRHLAVRSSAALDILAHVSRYTWATVSPGNIAKSRDAHH